MADPLLISHILLWLLLLVMAVVIFALARQVGILYERTAPAGALMVSRRLASGSQAPEMEVPDLDGRMVRVGGASADGRSTLIFFTSPTCPVCRSLLPVILSAARSEATWLSIVLASDGEEHDHRGYIAGNGLEGFPYVSSRAFGVAYGVSKLPYAVLVDGSGKVASFGIINSREHLESLFEAKERGVASIQEHLRA
ncbi:MAG: methylamine dehydrogenase accessory protein MauD [Gammaproteobacteria bacterium]|nr:methylamine dehydrogenase accessory protein MauD [Gammaproteobacteria bacterium]